MHAFYLDSPRHGQRFCVHHEADGERPRGRILYLAPFADEMNKARRMAALQARALAKAGFDVLQIDLLGCGDSSGDFGDASWEAWIDDVLHACEWLLARPSNLPLWLWGLRSGCLLAAEAHRRLAVPSHLLFVQPPVSGKPLLQQFLRLKLAGDMLDGSSKGLMARMRADLEQGQALEIAGYTLSAALAQGLETAQLLPPQGARASPPQLVWVELVSREDAQFSPVSQQAQQHWRDAGYALSCELVRGAGFWQTAEIEEVPALIEACSRLLLAADVAARSGA
ncbi:hydrolase 2, exosortase A system-associated [Paucibacter sp. JuS9]|uniref:hydrolase 2, exosortase A system-associated n=1 Tax=Paucibacter sp. JuS9 TaxID=3228748 RepID=UPI003757433F